MDLFTIIYTWFYTYIFPDVPILSDVVFELNGFNLDFAQWLSVTSTIITLCFIVAFLFLCVRWLFKVVAGLFTLRG